jgi:hypothetical protein
MNKNYKYILSNKLIYHHKMKTKTNIIYSYIIINILIVKPECYYSLVV